METKNTIKNPLKITYSKQLFIGYKVNKPNDQSGEYVSLELAKELLEALVEIYNDTEAWSDLSGSHRNRINNAIKKATT